MRRFISCVLVACILLGSLCMQSCGLLKSFLDDEGLVEYYDLKSNLHYASDMKVTSEATATITIYSTSTGGKMTSTATVSVTAVGINIGDDDMVYDRTVNYTLRDKVGNNVETVETSESESYFDGKGYYSYEKDSEKKQLYHEMSPAYYLEYLEISSYYNDGTVLHIDEWASDFTVDGKDNAGTISFVYEGIAEDHANGFENWVRAMLHAYTTRVKLNECKLVRTYDENSCVLTEETVTVDAEFRVDGYGGTIVYSESNKYSDPTDEDKPSADKYKDAVASGDFTEVARLTGYVNCLVFPMKEYDERYAFDFAQELEVKYRENSQSKSETSSVTNQIQLGYDSEKYDTYYYESYSEKDNIRYVYKSPYLAAYEDDARHWMEEYSEYEIMLSVESMLVDYMIKLYDVENVTVSDRDGGGQIVVIKIDDHEGYATMLGSINVNGTITLEYDANLELERISTEIIIVGGKDVGIEGLVSKMTIDNFRDAEFK